MLGHCGDEDEGGWREQHWWRWWRRKADLAVNQMDGSHCIMYCMYHSEEKALWLVWDPDGQMNDCLASFIHLTYPWGILSLSLCFWLLDGACLGTESEEDWWWKGEKSKQVFILDQTVDLVDLIKLRRSYVLRNRSHRVQPKSEDGLKTRWRPTDWYGT